MQTSFRSKASASVVCRASTRVRTTTKVTMNWLPTQRTQNDPSITFATLKCSVWSSWPTLWTSSCPMTGQRTLPGTATWTSCSRRSRSWGRKSWMALWAALLLQNSCTSCSLPTGFLLTCTSSLLHMCSTLWVTSSSLSRSLFSSPPPPSGGNLDCVITCHYMNNTLHFWFFTAKFNTCLCPYELWWLSDRETHH